MGLEPCLDWMHRTQTLRVPGSHPAEQNPELAHSSGPASGAEAEACCCCFCYSS